MNMSLVPFKTDLELRICSLERQLRKETERAEQAEALLPLAVQVACEMQREACVQEADTMRNYLDGFKERLQEAFRAAPVPAFDAVVAQAQRRMEEL